MTRWTVPFVGLAVVFAAGAVLAQAPELAAGPSDGEDSAPGADAVAAETAPTSADAILTEARNIVGRLEASALATSRMSRDARQAHDAVKALCLEDLLGQAEVARDTGAAHLASMEAAAAAGDLEKLQHDQAVMGALGERSGQLSAEASQCIGEERGMIGGATLNVSISPEIPRADTAETRSVVPPTVAPNSVDVQAPRVPDDVSPRR